MEEYRSLPNDIMMIIGVANQVGEEVVCEVPNAAMNCVDNSHDYRDHGGRAVTPQDPVARSTVKSRLTSKTRFPEESRVLLDQERVFTLSEFCPV